jgi:hypothetical protein
MGNTPISVGLRTDQSSYTAGDTVTGRVYVNVTKQAQAAQALLLQIRGEEHAVVHHTTEERDDSTSTGAGSRTNHHYEEGHYVFLQLEYPLHSFPSGSIPPGQYEYPFSIHLPASKNNSIPSSMHCRKGESYCEIKYELIASLRKPSSSSSSSRFMTSDPSSTQTLTMNAAPPPLMDPDTSLQLPREDVPVHNCCCVRSGTMALEVSLSQTILQPHDSVQVQFRCQNQSTIKVRTVRVQLQQMVEWNVDHHRHSETVTRDLDRKDRDAKEYPELAKQHRRRRLPRHARPHEQAVPFQQSNNNSTTNNNSNTTNWHGSNIRVPPSTYDSYMGRSVQVRHVLSVELLTKGCCTTNPEASALVQVFRKHPNVQQEPQEQPAVFVATASLDQPATAPALVVLPSALYEDPTYENASTVPSAPPGTSYGSSTMIGTTSSRSSKSSGTPIMAQAQLLPPDWHAQTAEVVDIPMAQVTILEPGVQMT